MATYIDINKSAAAPSSGFILSRPGKDNTCKMKSMIFLFLAFAISSGKGKYQNLIFNRQ